MTNWLAVLALSLVVASAAAQEVTGRIEGRVLSADGNALADAEVSVMSPGLLGQRLTATDRGGHFRLLALPVARYSVTVRQVGYRPVRYTDVTVALGGTTSIGALRLEPQVVAMGEIVVSADRPLIEPAATTTGGNLASDFFEALPVERDYRALATLVPGANTSFLGDAVNVAGSTGPENVYFIDGVNVTDPWLVRTGTSLPYNFIQEVEIKTGGYEAEFGRAQGGIINVITHSGGDTFSGQVFGYFTADALAGNPTLAVADANVADFTQYDAGISVGGPLVRDRLRFFAAYNPTFEQRELVIPGVSNQLDRRRQHRVAGRLTWQPTPRSDLALTVFGDPGTQDRVAPGDVFLGVPRGLLNPDPVLGNIREGGVTAALAGHHQVGSSWLVEWSLARYARHFDNQAASPRGRTDTLFIDNPAGAIWSGGYGFDIRERLGRTSVSLGATVLRRAHTLKAGVQWEDNSQDEVYVQNGIIKLSDSSFLAFPGLWEGTYHNRVPSVYVQDSWLATERLRLNAGLRWDGQYLVASDGRVAQSITTQWQPRVGFVYQHGPLGTQRVYASFGRFYEQMPLAVSSLRYTNSTFALVFYDHDPRPDTSGGMVLDLSNRILPEVPDLRGQHFDEFVLGYERVLGRGLKLGVRGRYRTLREVIDDTFVPDSGRFVVGNPGRGALSAFPRANRDHVALELTLEKTTGATRLLASYVLSRNHGNYSGLFNAESGTDTPNQSWPDDPAQFANSTGLLPNDRTHVFKLSGSHRYAFGMTAGIFFLWQTGTPLSEYLATPGQQNYYFLRPRGAVGRTPTMWDLNLRLTYDVPARRGGVAPRIVADLFHVASQRVAADVDQIHFFERDANGNPTTPNPSYGLPKRYQPPMSVRVGLVVGF